MAAGDIKFTFSGDSSQLQGEAAKARAALDGAGKAAEAAGKKIAGAGTATGAAGIQASKLGAAMGPLGGVLAKISPEAGSAAGSIAALTGGIQGLAGAGVTLAVAVPVLAAVAVAIGALAAVYASLTAASKEQARIDAIVEEGMKGIEDTATATARTLLQLELVTRGATAADTAHELALFDVAIATDKATKSSRDLIAANEKIISGRGAGVATLGDLAISSGELSAAFGDLAEDLDELDGGLESLAKSSGMAQGVFAILTGSIDWLTTSSAELRAQNEAATGTIDAQTEAINKAAAAALDLKDAEAAAAKASAAKAAGAKAAAEAIVESDAALAQSMARLVNQQELQDEHRQRSAEAQLAARNEEIRLIQMVADEEEDAAQRKIDAEAGWSRALAAVADQQRAELNANLSATSSVTGSISGLWDQLLANRLAGIDTSTKAGKAAAMEAWEQQKALAIATATIQAVIAIAQAVASAPPPANIPAIVVNTIAGAAQVVAAVAAPAPSFHAGGVLPPKLAPDEAAITMRKEEAMLSGQGRRAMGDDAIRAANAGRASGGASRGQIVYKHRAFEYFVADHLNMNGTLAKTIRRGDRVGQLRRGRT